MHYTTLYVVDIHDIRCLEPFLPPYDHFEILRFFGLGLSYGIPEIGITKEGPIWTSIQI